MFSNNKEEGNNTYLDNDEYHRNHFCIDELVSDFTDCFKEIEDLWTKKHLGCRPIREEISRLISLSSDHETLLEHLKHFIKELNDMEGDDKDE